VDKTNPKVSIVLPTFNGQKYIKKSIDSCLGQTLSNFELIIVDDCSSDQTPLIINAYNDPRIKCIRNEENKGLPRSLNTGFKEATGEYLTWTSDDNYYESNAILEMLNFLESEKSDFVFCDFTTFKYPSDDTSGAPCEQKRISRGMLPFSEGNFIGPCFMYSKKVRDSIGDYDPELQLMEDYDYWCRVSKGFAISYLNKALYFYLLHGDSLTSTSERERIAVLQFLVNVKNDLCPIRQVREHLTYFMARLIDIQLHFKGSMRIYKLWTKIMYSRRIDRILKGFHKKEITFTKAKNDLLVLFNLT